VEDIGVTVRHSGRPDSLEPPLDDGVEWLGAELYYAEVNELLKHSAESSAFIGHVRLLLAECTNFHDLSSAVLQKSVGMQVFRRNPEDLQILAADANYLWSALREDCRDESTRPLIKHKEHTPLKQAHNARMDSDAYHQRWMSETGFSLLKEDDGETLRSRSWHDQFRELTRKCIVHNLSQAAS
jgi:hypothetical protein